MYYVALLVTNHNSVNTDHVIYYRTPQKLLNNLPVLNV